MSNKSELAIIKAWVHRDYRVYVQKVLQRTDMQSDARMTQQRVLGPQIDQKLPAFHDLSDGALELRVPTFRGAYLIAVLERLGPQPFSTQHLHVAIKLQLPEQPWRACVKIAQRIIEAGVLVGIEDGRYQVRATDYLLHSHAPIKLHTPADVLTTLTNALTKPNALSEHPPSPEVLLAKVAIASRGRLSLVPEGIEELVFEKTGLVLDEWRKQARSAILLDFEGKVQALLSDYTTVTLQTFGDLLERSPLKFLLGDKGAQRLILICKTGVSQRSISDSERISPQAVSDSISNVVRALPESAQNILTELISNATARPPAYPFQTPITPEELNLLEEQAHQWFKNKRPTDNYIAAIELLSHQETRAEYLERVFWALLCGAYKNDRSGSPTPIPSSLYSLPGKQPNRYAKVLVRRIINEQLESRINQYNVHFSEDLQGKISRSESSERIQEGQLSQFLLRMITKPRVNFDTLVREAHGISRTAAEKIRSRFEKDCIEISKVRAAHALEVLKYPLALIWPIPELLQKFIEHRFRQQQPWSTFSQPTSRNDLPLLLYRVFPALKNVAPRQTMHDLQQD